MGPQLGERASKQQRRSEAEKSAKEYRVGWAGYEMGSRKVKMAFRRCYHTKKEQVSTFPGYISCTCVLREAGGVQTRRETS